MFLGISSFLEEISSLSHFTVFLYFFALFTYEGFRVSLTILWNSALRLFKNNVNITFSSVQSLSHVRLFATP